MSCRVCGEKLGYEPHIFPTRTHLRCITWTAADPFFLERQRKALGKVLAAHRKDLPPDVLAATVEIANRLEAYRRGWPVISDLVVAARADLLKLRQRLSSVVPDRLTGEL